MISRRTTLSLLACSAVTPAVAAPRSRLLDRRWQVFGESGDPDHSLWENVLRKNVSKGKGGINRFNYKKASKTDVATYITLLARVDPAKLTSGAAFAYWINLYNALTVQMVLSRYPVPSIKDIGGGLFGSGPWKKKLIEVNGQALSLDDIEHGILRPIWRTPLVHYAVNCASLGCPNLAATPYSSTNLRKALNDAASAYINHPRGAQVEGGRLNVSSIYNWFKSDFGKTDANVIAHLKQYARPDLARALAQVNRISNYDYDWRLND